MFESIITFLGCYVLAVIASIIFEYAWSGLYGKVTDVPRSWNYHLLLAFIILLCGALCGCHKKPAVVQSPTIIYGDTTRVKLVHRADQSKQSVTIIHQRNQPILNDYDKSVKKFDSINVALP